jgi:hypothetical protein
MLIADRVKKIKSYELAHHQLIAALEKFPHEMWQYKPSPDDWSIHEIIIHIADSEVSSYVRCRRCLAEPGSDVLGYDEKIWAQNLHYHEQNPDDALELFKWLRHKTYLLIKDLPEKSWANTIKHSENGVMTLDDWLDVYEGHIPNHIRQMQSVYESWVQLKTRANK